MSIVVREIVELIKYGSTQGSTMERVLKKAGIKGLFLQKIDNIIMIL